MNNSDQASNRKGWNTPALPQRGHSTPEPDDIPPGKDPDAPAPDEEPVFDPVPIQEPAPPQPPIKT